MPRLLALLSHPIPYLVPLMQRLASQPGLDLNVCFMADTGLKPGYVAGYGKTIQWDLPLLDGYPHRFLPNLSKRQRAGDPLSKVNPAIVSEIVKGRYDAVLLHGYVAMTEWMALAAAKALRLPVLFWGDVLIGSPPSGLSPKARELFRHGFCKAIDAALALSTQAKLFYERYGVPNDRIFWVPLCVDTERWIRETNEERPKRAAIRREFGLDPDLPVALFVAHMRPNKRPVDVAQALTRMKTKASLVMVGSGPLYDDLERFVRDHKLDRVHLAGQQNQSVLARYYAAADVFVLPSSPGEVTPLVVEEAMCSGLPVVISDAVPSILDFVREGENGYTFPVGDVDALADRLDRVLSDPAATARMSEVSRAIMRAWTYDVAVSGVMQALDVVAR